MVAMLDSLQIKVRLAARALGRAGLAHAYGHCSQRINSEEFLVCAPLPMGLIRKEPGLIVPIDGKLPEGALGEVRIHQQIYKRRQDVNGIVRSMPKAAMALSAARVTPTVRHGMGCYFYQGIGFWDDVQLIRNDESASDVADLLGNKSAVIMRGNGVVTASSSLEKAVVLTWYLEDAARIELDLRAAGLADHSAEISREEASKRATDKGGIFERMWNYLSAGDIESF